MKNKYERQIRLFGEKGQRKLKNSHVVVVGVGGVGSHIAQQLSHMGVGKITIIDNDKLEDTNLNRLIGVWDSDPINTPKVEIIERLIKRINPEIIVDSIRDSVISKRGFSTLKSSDFIFGCVDNDGVRSFLNEVVQAFKVPCIDIATEIHPDDLDYGGRLIFIDKEGCLYCYEEIDQEEVRDFFERPEAKKDRERIYGINQKDLGDSGPSVVTLNGIMASIATTEFMVHIIGLRRSKKFLSYNGKLGTVNKRTDKPSEGCYYCNVVHGSKQISYNFK